MYADIFKSIFGSNVPILEPFIRGSLVYLVLFAILRMIQKRQAGMLGNTDFLLILLLANAVQNALIANFTSFTDAVVVVAAIVFWNYILNWLGYRFPSIQRFIHPDPYPLILNGKIMKNNLKKELITYGELISQLRKQGIMNIEEVREAFIEGDGSISVIGFEKKPKPQQKKRGV
jgi:uncharacterized membrane protein YcaP (DUF421 family)